MFQNIINTINPIKAVPKITMKNMSPGNLPETDGTRLSILKTIYQIIHTVIANGPMMMSPWIKDRRKSRR
jgi:hypothetical protein